MAVNDVILALGPLGFWLTDCPDDPTAAHDAGSGAHDGTFYGTHSVGQSSLTADGDTSASFGAGAVLTPDISAPYIPSGDFSLALWFSSSDGGTDVAMGLYGGGSSSYWAGLNSGFAAFSFGDQLLSSPSACNDGARHFLVACRSGDDYNLYLDGSLVNTLNHPGVLFGAIDVFSVGNFAKTGSLNAFHFNGLLSKAAYFDKALTATDVTNIWTAGSSGGGGTASMSASPTSIQAGRKSATITLTGTGTTWTSGTTFTVSGGTKVSQSVASNTSATVVVDVGYSTGTLTIGDGSIGASASIVVPYTVSDATAGGQDVRVLEPWNYDAGTETVVVIYHHGAGETAASLTTDALKQGVVNALCGAGHLVCSSTAAGDNWGDQAGLDAYTALHTYMAANYNVGRILHFSQSMGGLTGLLTFAGVDNMPRTKGWFGVYPVCNLRDLYDIGTYADAIRTAYGIASDGTDYAAKTAGHDPALLAGSTFRNRMMRFYASNGDTVVPQAQNTDVIRTAVASYAREYGLVECTGNHGDPSHFQPDDVLSFVGRALASPPALASIAVPSDGLSVVLTFAEDVLPSTGITGFSATVDGSAASVSASRTASNVIILALGSPALAGQAVAVSYGSGNVTDLGSIALDDFTADASNGSTVPVQANRVGAIGYLGNYAF